MTDNDSAKSLDKGKGKANSIGNTAGGSQLDPTVTATRATASASANAPTVFSRIAQSAVSLGREIALNRPSGADLASLTSTDKAGPASRGQSLTATAVQEGSEGSTATVPSWALPTTDSSHAQQHTTAQDTAFAEFLDGADIDMSLPSEPSTGLDEGNNDHLSSMGSTWAIHQTSSQTIQEHALLSQPPSAVAEQESRDGAAVVDLLAADGPPEEEPDLGDIELAEDEIAALKRVLFGEENGNTNAARTTNQNWDNVLNLIPDFIRPNSRGCYEEDSGNVTLSTGEATKSRHTQAIMGLSHSSESSRHWLSQWHDVLTRYDDEVWGGLSPLVAQAREEVDRLQQSAPNNVPVETKALDRLRQILGHLRD
ncbi:hypothetical protein SEPCBS57363_000457 [Sporothrix epigloea]|uniref:Uncharacterized protein n=1 Tax=Sporothrix epigloea TaxID=1892477 RepID=A0ABP0D8K4_9PEZI